MPGKISWEISFKGLDQALNKFKEIERILQRIGNFKGFGSDLLSAGQQPSTSSPNSAGVGGGTGDGGGAALSSNLTKKWGYNTIGFQGTDPEKIRKQYVAGLTFLQKIQYEFAERMNVISTTFKTEGLIETFKVMRSTIVNVVGVFWLLSKAIHMITYVIGIAIRVINEGIKYGSHVYQNAAAMGTGIFKSTRMEEALKQVGITETPTFAMRNATSPQGVVGAAVGSGFGSAQQLLNMSKDFENAMKKSAISAFTMQFAARDMQILYQDIVNLVQNIKSTLAQTISLFSPIIHFMFEVLNGMLKSINLVLAMLTVLNPAMFKNLPGQPGQAQFGGAGGGMNITGWEKIGFTYGKYSTTEHLNNISNNTKVAADSLQKLVDIVQGKESKKPSPATSIFGTMPFLA
jgi:hypothetical protein